jgi:formylglycine-generating enzyme required for sulfatase activity
MKKSLFILTVFSISLLLTSCSQFETPLEIPESGSIQVLTTSDAKCTLYLSDKPVMEWTGSKILPGLMSGNYIVKITSDKFNSTFEEAIKLGTAEHKKLESGIGSLDIKIKSDFSWELSKEGKALFTGKGSYKIDTLWSGNYKVKVTIPGATNTYSKDLLIIKSQINILEMEYGTVDVRVPNTMEVTLLNGTTETTRWYGTKTVDSLWVGDYTVKIKVNPALPEYETSFKLAKQQTKTVELEYGLLDVRVQNQMECVLFRGSTEIDRWTGNRKIDSLWVGEYTVKIKVKPALPDYETSFTLAKQQTKIVELEYGSLDVRVQNQMECVLFRGSTEIDRWTGNRKIDSLWVGDYTVKIKVNPALPDYETSFTLVKQQTKVVELEYGTLDVKVQNQMECVLLRGTTELDRWTGTRKIDSLLVGDYTVKIKVNPLLPDYETSFTLAKQQIKIVELEYGSLDVIVQNQMECALLRGTTEIGRWTGNRKIDSLWVGDYTVKIKVNPALPEYETSFTLTKNQIKIVELEYGTLEVRVQDQMECVLFRGSTEIGRWTGNRKIDSLWIGDYTVKIKVNPALPEYETSFTLTKNQIKIVELEYGSLDVRVTSQTACKLFIGSVEIRNWTGRKIQDSLWVGNYTLKLKVHPSLPEYEENIIITNQQVNVVELQYGRLEVRVLSQMECILFRGTTEMERWNGSRTFDSLWVGDYTVKIKVNPALPEYETSFTLTKNQIKIVELEYGSLDVRVTSQTACKLFIGSVELRSWTGSKVQDSLWVGNYTLKLKVHPSLPEYVENIVITNQQVNVVELQYGRLEVRVLSQMECILFRGTTEMERWSGSRIFDSLWVGDYTVMIKINPLLHDYETSFTLAKQQTKIVEPLLGSFIIKTKSDYQNTLLLEGVEIVSWTGTKGFNPFIAGNYILKSKMYPSSYAIEQSFVLLQNENKIIEWEYGKITVNTLPVSTCKLKRGGNEILSWQGNLRLDSIITGNYTLEIQEAVNHPVWIENFILQKDEQKSISVPYAFIQITTNIPSSITKLIYNGAEIKSVSGSGEISNVVPGVYTLTTEAEGYIAQSESLTLSNGQILSRNIILVPPFTSMVTIPSGTFIMGCTSEQSGCGIYELPTHQVTLSAYEIGKYEITQKEWRTIMGTNPSHFTGDNKPVEQVSWYEILSFCNALSIREGLTPVYIDTSTANWSANGYRLPTEAEWEYAARGGASSTNTLYSGSNTLEDVGWYYSNSGNTTHDVGTKNPNQLGIYDMSGNVMEWCWDWYGVYSSQNQTNPKGPDSGNSRILRGGNWNFDANSCRIAGRQYDYPGNSWNPTTGFRLARTK